MVFVCEMIIVAGDSASGSVEEMFVELTLKAVTCANRTFNCWASYRYKHDPNTPIGIRSKSVSLLVQRKSVRA